METEGTFVILIPMEDALVHTDEKPFCADYSCPCHWDTAYRWEHVGEPLADGLLTEDEAARIFSGQQV